ncbi:hypothetical protein Sjap_000350 [Stephania japonica]|uniref:NAC domain-containing protein n=1 Tax=Stephania japonica TaxID=461633 RepID=A0AAP0KIU3_9MAGN
MTWSNNGSEDDDAVTLRSSPSSSNIALIDHENPKEGTTSTSLHQIKSTCPTCGLPIQPQQQRGGIQNLPGLPSGVKFDPTDQELLEHLEGKVRTDIQKLHPLIDEFIPTLEGENGICYTHPEKLPGVSKDGQIRHFFHRPSKAYTTGTRKRRKVHTDEEGGETRWHKTGKTRPVLVNGNVKGYKKILVLYTNYGKKKKPEKTNWVMHQYHLGNSEEEKDGELVVSKVFYQTQPRQCNSSSSGGVKDSPVRANVGRLGRDIPTVGRSIIEYLNPSFMSYDHQGGGQSRANPSDQLIPNFAVHAGGSSYIP